MRRRGANAVEFALLLPIFLTASWGMVEFSWLSYQQSSVGEAVERGCRTASLVDPGRGEEDSNALLTAAKARVLAEYDAECTTCGVTAVLVGEVPQRSLQCTLAAPYRGLTQTFDQLTRMTSTATSRLEFQRRIQ